MFYFDNNEEEEDYKEQRGGAGGGRELVSLNGIRDFRAISVNPVYSLLNFI